MSSVSLPRFYASCLPVVGPVLGFFNGPDEVEDAQVAESMRTYARAALMGSFLTVVTAIALFALSFSSATLKSSTTLTSSVILTTFVAPAFLLFLGYVGFGYNFMMIDHYDEILTSLRANRKP